MHVPVWCHAARAVNRCRVCYGGHPACCADNVVTLPRTQLACAPKGMPWRLFDCRCALHHLRPGSRLYIRFLDGAVLQDFAHAPPACGWINRQAVPVHTAPLPACYKDLRHRQGHSCLRASVLLFTADMARALCTQHVPLPVRDPDLCASHCASHTWTACPGSTHRQARSGACWQGICHTPAHATTTHPAVRETDVPRYSQKYPSLMDLAVSALDAVFCPLQAGLQSTCSTTRFVWLHGLACCQTVSATTHELIIDTSACARFVSNSRDVIQPLTRPASSSPQALPPQHKAGQVRATDALNCPSQTATARGFTVTTPSSAQHTTSHAYTHTVCAPQPGLTDSSMSHATCDHSAAAMCKGRVCTDSGWVARAANPNQTLQWSLQLRLMTNQGPPDTQGQQTQGVAGQRRALLPTWLVHRISSSAASPNTHD